MRMHLNLEIAADDWPADDGDFTTNDLASAACRAIESCGIGIISAHWHQTDAPVND